MGNKYKMEEKGEMKTTAGDSAAVQKKGPANASPENLDSYIRVTSPPVWAALIGILALVLGAFIWAMMGQLKVEVNSVALVKDGTLTCFVPLKCSENLNAESTVTVAGQTLRCGDAQMLEVHADGENAELLSRRGIDPASVVALKLPVSVDDGLYDARLVVETVSPFKLILG